MLLAMNIKAFLIFKYNATIETFFISFIYLLFIYVFIHLFTIYIKNKKWRKLVSVQASDFYTLFILFKVHL